MFKYFFMSETPGFIKFKEKDLFTISIITAAALSLFTLFYIPIDVLLHRDFRTIITIRIYASICFAVIACIVYIIRHNKTLLRASPFVIILTASFLSASITNAAGVTGFLYWGGFVQILFSWFFIFPQKPVTSMVSALVFIVVFNSFLIVHTGFSSEIISTSILPGNSLVFGTYIIGVIASIIFYNNRYRLYHSNLEIEIEQAKNEKLLRNILPSEIVERLKQSDSIIADTFTSVAILFSDITNFTVFCQGRESSEIVTILNQIFYAFDKKTEELNLEKIKTMGDGYMVMAGGLESINQDLLKTIDLGRYMIEFIRKFNQENGYDFGIRIGVHIGSVTAGVIGKTKFAFDVWGDTVNIASRMESTGISMCINVTEQVAMLLDDQDKISYRGEIDIKGIGKTKTFTVE